MIKTYTITPYHKNAGKLKSREYKASPSDDFISYRRERAKEKGWKFRKKRNEDVWIQESPNCVWEIRLDRVIGG